ncbi:fructose-bisphosphate aldolase [Nesidiocoris tenuis]|uniref:fructose-bisphosphate aldolase n=1 Tax=Nesidiocoris tenuis TaxID=355587 RepID=A0ABN7A5Z1_9HEMI|nr:fructose-bisphosphate aldolase [Nesidiocoris tenuis]
MEPTKWMNRPEYLEMELWKIAKHLFWPGKGILGCDESVHTLGKRFQCVGIANESEARRQWRKLIFDTPSLGDYVSGVIMHPETILQTDDDGESFIANLRSKGIVSGVKLDEGVQPLSCDEPITVGLENLAAKCEAFKNAGIHFAKWRCVYRITKQTPTTVAIQSNALTLARFANICQTKRLVPIIEPDIEQDGKHSLRRMEKVTEAVLSAVVKAMQDHNVYLEGAILKINFVTPGMQCSKTYSLQDMAECTVEVLRRTIPPSLQGICFLAGSLKESEATALLDAVVKTVAPKPWYITFSFSRGVHMSTLELWRGNPECVVVAHIHLTKRLEENKLAALGKLIPSDNWSSPTQDGEMFIHNHSFLGDGPRKPEAILASP